MPSIDAPPWAHLNLGNVGMNQWSSGRITWNDSDDLGSIPGKINF
jgi:hypothetical protein